MGHVRSRRPPRDGPDRERDLVHGLRSVPSKLARLRGRRDGNGRGRDTGRGGFPIHQPMSRNVASPAAPGVLLLTGQSFGYHLYRYDVSSGDAALEMVDQWGPNIIGRGFQILPDGEHFVMSGGNGVIDTYTVDDMTGPVDSYVAEENESSGFAMAVSSAGAGYLAGTSPSSPSGVWLWQLGTSDSLRRWPLPTTLDWTDIRFNEDASRMFVVGVDSACRHASTRSRRRPNPRHSRFMARPGSTTETRRPCAQRSRRPAPADQSSSTGGSGSNER